MSPRRPHKTKAEDRKRHASVFAALGDETRLALLAKLCDGYQVSITQLALDSPISRQAITKHLQVLERAGIVHVVRAGRQSLFELRPKPLEQARDHLGVVSRQWNEALGRLRSFVERNTEEK
ncbi:MAG: ArsR/SmtB family transcription factor [Bryobacteraceae bacterium]